MALILTLSDYVRTGRRGKRLAVRAVDDQEEGQCAIINRGMLKGRMNGHSIGTIMNRGTAKAKKSFTLSRSSVAFLERLRKKRRASSTSLILDELIRDAEARQRQKAIGEAISSYYDRLSPAELEEQESWGEFALEQWRGQP